MQAVPRRVREAILNARLFLAEIIQAGDIKFINIWNVINNSAGFEFTGDRLKVIWGKGSHRGVLVVDNGNKPNRFLPMTPCRGP